MKPPTSQALRAFFLPPQTFPQIGGSTWPACSALTRQLMHRTLGGRMQLALVGVFE